MQIGKNSIPSKEIDKLRKSIASKNLNELSPQEHREAVNDFKKEYWNPAWDNQQHTGQGLTLPKIASKYGNVFCANDSNPDPTPPKELFNFDLILNGRKFRVVCDTLLRIKTDEDLSDYSEQKLIWCLEQCASYRITCFCAYVAAHKERVRWEEYHRTWEAEKRKEARLDIRNSRVLDKTEGLRKDIGQIAAVEVDDWITLKYGKEYKYNTELIRDWEDNEKIFLELRDTLKDRGNHLQSILRRMSDHTAGKSSDPTPESSY